jgi:hypothetical protein
MVRKSHSCDLLIFDLLTRRRITTRPHSTVDLIQAARSALRKTLRSRPRRRIRPPAIRLQHRRQRHDFYSCPYLPGRFESRSACLLEGGVRILPTRAGGEGDGEGVSWDDPMGQGPCGEAEGLGGI